jgi:hypothetical protein
MLNHLLDSHRCLSFLTALLGCQTSNHYSWGRSTSFSATTVASLLSQVFSEAVRVLWGRGTLHRPSEWIRELQYFSFIF